MGLNHLSDGEAALRIVNAIEDEGGRAVPLQADVSDEQQVKSLFARSVDHFGTVDIIVANAGIQKDAPFVDMTLEDWNKVVSVNLTGAFLCAREAAREFIRRGPRRNISRATGKIIFISSVHQEIPWAGRANYAATKGGLELLMGSIAQELAEHKIRVNSIAPGAIKTRIDHDAWETPQARAKLRQLIPYGRIGEPDDVARAVVRLASDDADYVHGTTLYVDGGMTLYPGFSTGGG